MDVESFDIDDVVVSLLPSFIIAAKKHILILHGQRVRQSEEVMIDTAVGEREAAAIRFFSRKL